MSEIDDIRAILASTDVGSLPDDYPTVRMAEDRMRTLNERTLEGLALIGKFEAAAARIERLDQECTASMAEIATERERAEKAEARIERLEEALRRLGNHWKYGYGDHTRGGVIRAVEDIARAALGEEPFT